MKLNTFIYFIIAICNVLTQNPKNPDFAYIEIRSNIVDQDRVIAIVPIKDAGPIVQNVGEARKACANVHSAILINFPGAYGASQKLWVELDKRKKLYENKMFFSGGMLDKNDKTHGKIKWNDFKTVYTGIKNSHQWNFATDLNEDCVFFQWTENDNIFFFTQKCHTPAHYICQKLKDKNLTAYTTKTPYYSSPRTTTTIPTTTTPTTTVNTTISTAIIISAAVNETTLEEQASAFSLSNLPIILGTSSGVLVLALMYLFCRRQANHNQTKRNANMPMGVGQSISSILYQQPFQDNLSAIMPGLKSQPFHGKPFPGQISPRQPFHGQSLASISHSNSYYDGA